MFNCQSDFWGRGEIYLWMLSFLYNPISQNRLLFLRNTYLGYILYLYKDDNIHKNEASKRQDRLH